MIGIFEGDRDFGHARARAPRAAAKNYVFGAIAAESTHALFAQGPADGVGHVALAGTVRSDDGGDAGIEFEPGPAGEALESDYLQAAQVHSGSGPVGLGGAIAPEKGKRAAGGVQFRPLKAAAQAFGHDFASAGDLDAEGLGMLRTG